MIVVRSFIHHSPLIEKFQGCADFPTFVVPSRQVIRLLFEIIVSLPISPCLSSPFFFLLLLLLPSPSTTRPDIFLLARLLAPLSEPLKWQSFLRRRPVEAKRGERSTSSSLDALRFSYAATSRVSGSTERTRRMNITVWTVCSGSW